MHRFTTGASRTPISAREQSLWGSFEQGNADALEFISFGAHIGSDYGGAVTCL
jgi:hypothetical protein